MAFPPAFHFNCLQSIMAAPAAAKLKSTLAPTNAVLPSSSSSLAGTRLSSAAAGKARVTCETKDRWAGLSYDISDDQQDITRGKGMVDSAFQGGWGQGTQVAVMTTYDYISQGQRK